MNTINQLVISGEQETNRIAKGYEIYKQELITRLSETEFEVKGRYIVEDIDAVHNVFTCSCPDHQNRLTQCKHIIAVQFYLMGL